ncbi:MAG: hypothetical protein HY520_05180 [Candidatus Aenigmarchaeota archaeon]|nr:hypothetical protein [Candidatus Aenigmarchaeota archaeon]
MGFVFIYIASSQFALASSNPPQLTSHSVTPELGGWGETFTFRVTASDADNDSITVYLWVRKPYEPFWSLVGENSSYPGGMWTVEFKKSSFTSSDIGQVWQYKFNATDSTGLAAETSNGSFTVEADDIEVQHVQGNNSVVNRVQGNYTSLSTRVLDTDTNRYIVSGYEGRLWVSTDHGATFGIEGNPTTAASGYLNYPFFNPDCRYHVGPQYWIMGLIDNTTYKDTNSSIFTLTITTDPLKGNVTSPHRRGYVAGQQEILFRGRLADDCGPVEGVAVVFSAERSGQAFACPLTLEEGNGFYNCTVPASMTASWPTGLFNASMLAGKVYYTDGKATKADAFRICPRATANGTSGGISWRANSRCLY